MTFIPVPGGELVTVRERTPRSRRELELERLAHVDGLTGLLNQRSFRTHLAAEAARRRAAGEALSLLVLDLDHFKAINDAHGHPAGDRVLAEAARRLREVARTDDVVGRVGGEEFAWLLPDAGVGPAVEAAERLRAAIADRRFGPGLAVTASIGVCELHAGGTPNSSSRGPTRRSTGRRAPVATRSSPGRRTSPPAWPAGGRRDRRDAGAARRRRRPRSRAAGGQPCRGAGGVPRLVAAPPGAAASGRAASRPRQGGRAARAVRARRR